jgi:hypothetical protein
MHHDTVFYGVGAATERAVQEDVHLESRQVESQVETPAQSTQIETSQADATASHRRSLTVADVEHIVDSKMAQIAERQVEIKVGK